MRLWSRDRLGGKSISEVKTGISPYSLGAVASFLGRDAAELSETLKQSGLVGAVLIPTNLLYEGELSEILRVLAPYHPAAREPVLFREQLDEWRKAEDERRAAWSAEYEFREKAKAEENARLAAAASVAAAEKARSVAAASAAATAKAEATLERARRRARRYTRDELLTTLGLQAQDLIQLEPVAEVSLSNHDGLIERAAVLRIEQFFGLCAGAPTVASGAAALMTSEVLVGKLGGSPELVLDVARLTRFLANSGYRVETARTVKIGQKLLNKHADALVLLYEGEDRAEAVEERQPESVDAEGSLRRGEARALLDRWNERAGGRPEQLVLEGVRRIRTLLLAEQQLESDRYLALRSTGERAVTPRDMATLRRVRNALEHPVDRPPLRVGELAQAVAVLEHYVYTLSDEDITSLVLGSA